MGDREIHRLPASPKPHGHGSTALPPSGRCKHRATDHPPRDLDQDRFVMESESLQSTSRTLRSSVLVATIRLKWLNSLYRQYSQSFGCL
jgi:hypothetical protein